MEWVQVAAIITSLGGAIGLQTFWVAREIDALRSEMHRGFDRVEARLDRLEGREPPSLRQV